MGDRRSFSADSDHQDGSGIRDFGLTAPAMAEAKWVTEPIEVAGRRAGSCIVNDAATVGVTIPGLPIKLAVGWRSPK